MLATHLIFRCVRVVKVFKEVKDLFFMELTIHQALQKAIEAHKTGKFQDAERLYRAILRAQPQHPDANHNLGVLAVGVGQPQAALPYLKAALEANRSQGQFWVSYINALFEAKQTTEAAKLLEEGKKIGLTGEAIVQLEQELNGQSEHKTLNQIQRHNKTSPTKKAGKTKAGKRSAPASQQPSQQEINELLASYNAQNFDLAYEQAQALIKAYPNHAFGWKVLGAVFKSKGKLNECLESMLQSVKLAPHDAEAHYNLGNVLKDLGRLTDAEECCREAIRLKPDFAQAHSNLGNVLKDLGRLTDAEECCREAIRLKPDFAQAHSNLGNVLKDLGRLTDAEASIREAIRLKPDFAQAHSNLGIVLKDLGRLTEAEASIREAIRLKPYFAQAHSNLGIVLKDLGRLTEAEASYREAIRLKPDFAQAHSNLGNVLKDLGRLTDAEASIREAIRLKPDFAEAHSNLGIVLKDLGRLTEAEASYREAIRLKPDYAEAHSNLGNVLKDLGRLTDAEASYREAIRLQPDVVDSLYKLSLLLPDIYDTQESIRHWRIKYEAGLTCLIEKKHELHNPARVVSPHTFNLAYHNQSNVKLMQLRSQLVSDKVKDCNYVAPHILDWKQPKSRKIKIAFCSNFLGRHTIGKLYQGIIKQLDREIFEVIVIHASRAKRDNFSHIIDKTADKVLRLNPVMTTQLTQISNEKLDILFYPDIGMHAETFYLAHTRLAPIQVVSWGHPDTTGIATIDYFVSSSLIEPYGADQQYSERLIRLNRLPCYYQPLIMPTQIPDRVAMKLPENMTLYGCPQSLFKIHPDFDAVLVEISDKDLNGRIVMIEGTSPAWSVLLRERWENSYPILNEKVTFIPRQPLEKFMSLIANIDVLLDPIYFGSGNTMYESSVCGIPTVTWQGQFMRGRIVAGAYKQLKIKDPPIAAQISNYAPLAVELGKNFDKRMHFKDQLLNAVGGSLYSDYEAVREFEEFFLSAIDAADKGEKLPVGWAPSSMNRSLN